MDIRVRAALYTVGYLASAIISVLAVHQLVAVLTVDQIQMVFGGAFLGFMCYCLYSITLNRLEYEAKIKEISELPFND